MSENYTLLFVQRSAALFINPFTSDTVEYVHTMVIPRGSAKTLVQFTAINTKASTRRTDQIYHLQIDQIYHLQIDQIYYLQIDQMDHLHKNHLQIDLLQIDHRRIDHLQIYQIYYILPLWDAVQDLYNTGPTQ